jgi:hypothetical protein
VTDDRRFALERVGKGREALPPLRIDSLAEGTVTELPEVGTPSLMKPLG